ncbi:MAG: DUF4003 domain-containing protein [Lachnospiraceae bacterium]|jgi:hypothetical protein|nr:DUF4003 domain-containing protein [Lachnospiraceae bacterium]
MIDTWKEQMELFVDNTHAFKKEFVLHNGLKKLMAALQYAQAGKAIDAEAIHQCYELIKKNTGVFSTFRGDMGLCIATMLSLSPDPQGQLTKTLKVYDQLKAVKFYPSDYLVIAAYQIAAAADPADYEVVVDRTRKFYEGMKKHHFFYTAEDDYIFVAMLGLTELDPTAGVERIERLYTQLAGEFWDKNSVQTLAQVLVLGDSSDSVSMRVLALRDALREQKIKLDKTYTLPVLGILALMPVELSTIVNDLGAAQDTLRAQKGFGALSLSTQELLVFAASVVAASYAENIHDGNLSAAMLTTINNIIIAQQAAMVAMIAATAATSSAASS